MTITTTVVATINIATENSYGGHGDASTQGDKLTYPWPVASDEACS